jgi:hypothetical protein
VAFCRYDFVIVGGLVGLVAGLGAAAGDLRLKAILVEVAERLRAAVGRSDKR